MVKIKIQNAKVLLNDGNGTETKISLAKKEARENISKKQKIPDDSLEDLSQKISGIKKAIAFS